MWQIVLKYFRCFVWQDTSGILLGRTLVYLCIIQSDLTLKVCAVLTDWKFSYFHSSSLKVNVIFS